MLYVGGSQTVFRGETPGITSYSEKPVPTKTKYMCMCMYTYKQTVVGSLRLLQCFQLPDKNSRDISRYIYNCFAVFQNSCVFIPLFLLEPLKMFCGSVLFRETLFKKQLFVDYFPVDGSLKIESSWNYDCEKMKEVGWSNFD